MTELCRNSHLGLSRPEFLNPFFVIPDQIDLVGRARLMQGLTRAETLSPVFKNVLG